MGNKLCKQIDLGVNPVTGKRVRKRIYGTSKADLERNIRAAVADYGKHGLPSSLTYKAYKEKWEKTYYANIAPGTKLSYESCLKHADCLNDIKMSNITRTDIQNIITSVKDTPITAQRLTILLHNIWDSAVLDGVVDKNIVIKIKTPKKEKSQRRALTETELEAVKKADLNDQERMLVNILRQFGLRPGEALALTYKDFDKNKLTLTINKAIAFDGEKPYIKSTKTGVSRTIPVPKEFFKLIEKPKNGLYLFNVDGRLLTRSEKLIMCREICEKINVAMGGNKKIKATPMTLYYFRHTKATELYYMQSKGVTLKMAAAYLGHSEQMLIKIYSHLDEENENTDMLRTCVI